MTLNGKKARQLELRRRTSIDQYLRKPISPVRGSSVDDSVRVGISPTAKR